MIRSSILIRGLLAGTILAATPAIAAADAAETAAPHDRNAPGDFHAEPGAEIVVTAPFQRQLGDALSGISVVSGEELAREMRPTIGETLTRQPGVSATSFGPNASRPVLRGFQGERVRVLTDGIGSFDVSNTSVDHAVAINPLTAKRIEVLRGPSALLFGSSAIGGVVNLLDGRIPRAMPDDAVHVEATGTYGSAAKERSGGALIEVPVADTLVLHIDGSYSKTDDLETGGFILSRPLRAEAAASDDPEVAANATLKGKLPNSQARSWDVAGGATIIRDGGSLGFSVSRLESRYGIPERLETVEHAHEEGEAAEEDGHGHEQVRLDMRQTRADLRGEVETGGGFLEKIRLRAGYADYQHDEIEPDGAIGTSFFNKGAEGRLEFVQKAQGSWRGAFGGQILVRDFRVVGEEKFLPASSTEQFGLFTLQEFDVGPAKAEFGVRYERTNVEAAADDDLGNPDIERRFSTLSGSVGASVPIADGWRFGVSLARSERAPAAEELFANGPHAGTQSFEIGDPGFTTEKSWGVEGVLRGRGPGYSLDLSVHHSWFDDYIYEFQTGEEIDELPVYQFAQADARYWGFEIEGSATLAQVGDVTIVADALADYVRARIVSAGPAPRIPPLRVLGGLEAQTDRINARIEAEWTNSQRRVTLFETTTPGFTMVNASLSFQPFEGNKATSIMLSANNLFDVTARRHASVLKDYAPLAGRDIRVTARVSF